MIRLQTALPERYSTAHPDQLARWIGDAKDDPRRPAGHPRPPLPARRGHPVRRRPRRLLPARPAPRRTRPDADYIVFCGVHFMAETADILTGDRPGRSSSPTSPPAAPWPTWPTSTPSRTAGSAESGRRRPTASAVIPVTYMNSSAALKAFCRRARRRRLHVLERRPVLEWAFAAGGRSASSSSPTSTSAATPPTTWAPAWTTCASGTPDLELGGTRRRRPSTRAFLLWKGHCSVHQRFRSSTSTHSRAEHPAGIVIVHPECPTEVVEVADLGLHRLHRQGHRRRPRRSTFGIGTEIHLVKRLDDEHPDQDHRLARPHRLPVLDHVPHRPPPPGLGARGARRRRGPQPHLRRRRDGPVGPGGAGADAGHHLNAPAAPTRWRTVRRGRRPCGAARPAAAPAPHPCSWRPPWPPPRGCPRPPPSRPGRRPRDRGRSPSPPT